MPQNDPRMYQNALAQGYQGTQSGPAQESGSAYYERLLQELLGWGVGGVGGAAGMTMGGAAGGFPGFVAGGAAGMAPGTAAIVNAQNPNIQDVWAHQYMQRLRRGY